MVRPVLAGKAGGVALSRLGSGLSMVAPSARGRRDGHETAPPRLKGVLWHTVRRTGAAPAKMLKLTMAMAMWLILEKSLKELTCFLITHQRSEF